MGISLYAHVTVYPDAANYTGPLALLDRVFDVVFAWSLLALSFCVGRTCCAALSIPFAGLAEEFAFSVFTGMGALALAVLGLGLAGLLKPIPAAALALLSILISHRQIPRLALLLTGALNAATLSRQRVIVALLLVALALMLVLRAATPPHSFDEAIYHLAITKSFVARGRVFPVVENWAGDMPFLVHMIYALCLMAKADIAAKVFSWLLALTCALGIYAFCSRFLDKTTGAIAMLVFFAAGMVVEVAVTARIDVSLAAVLFLATYAMFVCLESKNEPGAGRWLFLSGIMSGLALGIKYSAGIWIALLGLVFVFESLRTRKRSILELAKHGGGFVLIAFLLSSPWFAKNLVWFHNPVYPFVT
ncbi:MAG TPA: glycosyltransferase family 39 protein, partial [Blastocatellia bacterium]|nr:glycosyltransferase family 39 protein [Blastocatellia bacterium]